LKRTNQKSWSSVSQIKTFSSTTDYLTQKKEQHNLKKSSFEIPHSDRNKEKNIKNKGNIRDPGITLKYQTSVLLA
jgi:hypothetical protein